MNPPLPPTTIGATEFKERCLALLDQVDRDRVPLVVTKRGRPVARIVPIEEPATGRPTMGSVRLLADEDEAYYTTGEGWEAAG